MSVTPRTAGFNTVDVTLMSGVGQAILIALMIIGGSPGSTAGGIKTTTFAVLIANTFSVFRKKEDVQLFKRRLDNAVVRSASTILVLYISLFFISALVISRVEDLPFGVCLFETASAIGTVGLSLGITPGLCAVSKLIIILLMFFGRVGGLTLIYAALSGTKQNLSKLPQEKIMIG